MKVLWILGIDLDIPLWQVLVMTLCVLLVIYYRYMTKYFGIFKEMGIPGPKPVPILGNIRLLQKLGIFKSDRMLLDQYAEGGKFVGIFMGREPQLISVDLSFNKQVLVKEFNCFMDRIKIDLSSKPLSRGLSILKGEEWRTIRNTLTPTFSGGKIKMMIPKIETCSTHLVENITEYVQQDKAFDLLDLASSFTMDVIARTAFGLEINCQKDKDNLFVKHGKASQNTSLKAFLAVIFLAPFSVKWLSKWNLLTSIPTDAKNFFSSISKQTLESRKSSSEVKRVDFMQLMVNAHKEETKLEDMDEENRKLMEQDIHKKKILTEEDILGNSLLFFLAGFDTVATALAFAGYHLIKQPEIQEKLFQEIDSVLPDKKPPTYEILNNKLPYLEEIVNETLRLHPPAQKVQRICNKAVTINGIHIPMGMEIGIPIQAIHMDPELYPEPEKFIPERFSAEEKANRDQYAYLPFGLGPRSCIAMRLGLIELKYAIVVLVQNFKLVKCGETEEELTMHPLRNKPLHGVMMKAENRK